MVDLLTLSEMEHEDSELVPEIFEIDARLSVQGSVEKFIGMFSAAASVTPLKEIIPNTSQVLFEAFDASKDALSYAQITATDGDRSLVFIEDGLKINLSGSALLPGKKILDILRLISISSVRLDVIGTTATLRAGRAIWTVQTEAPYGNSLPPVAYTGDITLYPLNRKEFISAFERTQKAAAKSSSRLSLMQAELSKGKITTCDAARAHRVEVNIPKTVYATLPMNLIDVALRELRSLNDDTFLFGASGSTVVFHFGKNILSGQRFTLDYPNVDHLMLEPALLNTETLSVSVSELREAVKRVRVNSDPDFMAVTLSLREIKGDWTLTVRARDKSGNASQESILVSYDGPDTVKELVLNHKYLTEFLDCLDSEKVDFKLGQSTKSKQAPIYVQDGSFTGVLMPMAPNVVKL